MKNITGEKPDDELHGRALFNTQFFSDEDVFGKIILDIGCGFGWFEVNAAERGCKEIVGMEFEERYLETAKKHIHKDNVSFAVGSATDIPFPEESFDTVVSWEVIEHIPKNTEEKMFREAARVLKKGGKFYLSTPYDSFWSKIFDPAWWLIGHRHYGKKQLLDLVKSNGFEVEKLIIRGGLWEIIGINNLYIAKWIFRRRPFFERKFNQLMDIEYQSKKEGFETLCLKVVKQ